MLVNLHVKNLALIEEAEVYFDKGLNILTGETGAGKSLIIGSVNIALGGKISKDMIRENCDSALVELIFQVESEQQVKQLADMDIETEDGQVIMQRKITDGRTVSKINGETVTAGTMKAAAEVLIDIHGQHEHQSLLYKKHHLEILDEFADRELGSVLTELKEIYTRYCNTKKELEESFTDTKERARECSLLEYEINEITEARLKAGEDEQLEADYKRMLNSKKIMSSMSTVYKETGYDSGAGDAIGRALRELKDIADLDTELMDLRSELLEIDELLNDFNRQTSDYMTHMSFEDSDFQETEDRLNKINHLKSKYGKHIDEILLYLERQTEKLNKYNDYDHYIQSLENRQKEEEKELAELSEKAFIIRCKYALELGDKMKEALIDLNFTNVDFQIDVRKAEGKYTARGYDEAEFMLSANPGEKLKPLINIASGGELSRIMLALKTVLAQKDQIDTLIFDEIDTGISGRTAQKVSEKLALLAKDHQVICITHLPQIASMADQHFRIIKKSESGGTTTGIEKLTKEESVEELARLLGGAEITETVRRNAAEMKELAEETKR